MIAYENLTIINPDSTNGLRKYAEVLEDPRCRNQNIDRAIEYFERALNLTAGSQNKHDIAIKMEKLYRKMGRDNEIKNIQQYLDNDKDDGFLSEDEDEEDNGSFF